MGLRSMLAFSVLLLGGCAGPIETRIASSGPGLVQPQSIMREEVAPTGTSLAARNAVLAMLANRGFAEADTAELQLQVAMSERDAAVAVSTTVSGRKRDIAAAKKRKPLQSCADREIRLSVVLTRISDGALLYRGDAAEYHCRGQLADLIEPLAESALADLNKPRGAYTATRTGIE
jgi:hypothetical protein